MKDVVGSLGRLDHWRFAIKPGRPLAMGVVGGTAFCGLPGNPVAVFVTFTQVVPGGAGGAWRRGLFRAALPSRARGLPAPQEGGPDRVPAVALEDGANGPRALRYPVEGAGIISSLTATDGLVRLAVGPPGGRRRRYARLPAVQRRPVLIVRGAWAPDENFCPTGTWFCSRIE